MIKTVLKTWIVHLALPNAIGEFLIEIVAECEAGAASRALQMYPQCYIVYTSEKAE